MEKCSGSTSVNAPQGDCLIRIFPTVGDVAQTFRVYRTV